MADIRVGALTIRFVVENESLSMFECHVPARGRVPVPHSHDAFEETIYGLKGLTHFTVEGVTRDLRAGDGVHIPRGVVHGFNVGDEDSAFLAVATPGSAFGSAYFTDIAEVVAAGASGPPDREAMAAAMRRHGLTPFAPAN